MSVFQNSVNFLFQTYRASLLKISVFHLSDETTSGAIMKSPDEQKRTTITPVFVAAIAVAIVAIVAILCFMLKTYSKQHIGPLVCFWTVRSGRKLEYSEKIEPGTLLL